MTRQNYPEEKLMAVWSRSSKDELKNPLRIKMFLLDN